MKVDPDWHWKTYAVAAAGIIVLGTLVLLGMGRTMWGAADGFGFWSGDIHSKFNSQRLADPYSFSHISHGLVFFLLLSLLRDYLVDGVRFLVAVFMESTWEVVENTPFVIERFRETTIAQGYYGDSVLNCIGDIFCCIIGFSIALRFGNKWALAAFVGLEILLAFWIRDNMTLNIIMLIYPVPGIREWQAG